MTSICLQDGYSETKNYSAQNHKGDKATYYAEKYIRLSREMNNKILLFQNCVPIFQSAIENQKDSSRVRTAHRFA